MKVQKKVSVRGEWAKIGKDIKDGDTVTILDAGQQAQGEYGMRDVFNIQCSTGEKNQSFNQTTMNNLIDAFGDETEKWVGKEVRAWTLRVMIGGTLKNVVYFAHPEWVMDDEGKFENPNATKIPKDNINPDDIPF